MARNVEIKARVEDMESVERRAVELADGGPTAIGQEDVFFEATAGRLKLRAFPEGTGELIWYERPDTPEPSTSRYLIHATDAPGSLRDLLSRALGVRGVVRKRRTLYTSGRTRIHLDRVDGLGGFLELEVVLGDDETPADGERTARELMERLGVAPDRLVDVAYIDLLERKEAPTDG